MYSLNTCGGATDGCGRRPRRMQHTFPSLEGSAYAGLHTHDKQLLCNYFDK